MTGTRGALTTVLGQPFGRTLLLVAAIGLFGYAAWRVLQGLLDPDRLGHDWRGLAIRVSFVAARRRARGAGLAGIPPISRAVGVVGNQRA